MNFQELLNDLCHRLNCTQNDLATASGLSAPVISRYLSGERTPAIDSEQLDALAKGLSHIASERGMDSTEYGYEQIISDITNALRLKKQQYSIFLNNFNSLIDCLDIKMKDLAKGIHFDASFLYRVRSGERHPANLDSFCNLIAFYIADRYTSESDIKKAACFLHCEPSDLSSRTSYAQQILRYFNEIPQETESPVNVSSFLCKMDEFDLDEYIEAIHFNDIKIPTTPIHLPVSRYYYGIADMRRAELDFFKTTVMSKSAENVFMYGDMPMNDMAEDMEFNMKWMFGIAATLKKGLNINIIHNLDRPFDEIVLGLEAWIPIYMTGQVSPYHLEGYKNDVFHQLNYCSGSAALFGECIDNYHSEGRYYLSTNRHDIAYYRSKTNALLKHAKPLMDIYNSSKAHEYMEFFKNSMSEDCTERHIIASSLPLYTMPEDLLKNMVSSLPSDIQQRVLDFYHNLRNATANILENNRIVYDYHILSEKEFSKESHYVSVPELFIPPFREYSYDEYVSHVKATMKYRKCKSPNIHFVIRHSKMLSAMENFYIIKKEPKNAED